jgi:L-alanine-DL-glutamate epimerase-like enolase superfamily enzyme
MKLMKCGGITEALRIIGTARAYKLKTMIGCMSESSVSIAAAASLTGGIDHIDLDSHYNLSPDPAMGAPLINGITLPQEIPGHGAELKKEFYA